MIREELRRLSTWGERHRRLLARVMIALALSLVVDALGAGLVWYFEHGVKSGDIHDFGDAAFFSTVQLLTVSSQIKNPLTTGGRVSFSRSGRSSSSPRSPARSLPSSAPAMLSA
jgi:hypothetical protein